MLTASFHICETQIHDAAIFLDQVLLLARGLLARSRERSSELVELAADVRSMSDPLMLRKRSLRPPQTQRAPLFATRDACPDREQSWRSDSKDPARGATQAREAPISKQIDGAAAWLTGFVSAASAAHARSACCGELSSELGQAGKPS